jgi:hypothetical protein
MKNSIKLFVLVQVFCLGIFSFSTVVKATEELEKPSEKIQSTEIQNATNEENVSQKQDETTEKTAEKVEVDERVNDEEEENEVNNIDLNITEDTEDEDNVILKHGDQYLKISENNDVIYTQNKEEATKFKVEEIASSSSFDYSMNQENNEINVKKRQIIGKTFLLKYQNLVLTSKIQKIITEPDLTRDIAQIVENIIFTLEDEFDNKLESTSTCNWNWYFDSESKTNVTNKDSDFNIKSLNVISDNNVEISFEPSGKIKKDIKNLLKADQEYPLFAELPYEDFSPSDFIQVVLNF